jgi:hypothetical protein
MPAAPDPTAPDRTLPCLTPALTCRT